MSIKGYDIGEMLIIEDRTPGQTFLLFLVVMLLMIFILYQLVYIYWEQKKLEKLRFYENKLKQESKKIREYKKEEKTEKKQHEKRPAVKRIREELYTEEEIAEANKIMETLRN